MMLWLKIILYVITGMSGILSFLLQHIWHDKRTRIYQRLRNFLPIIIVVIAVIAIILAIGDDKNSKSKEEAYQKIQESDKKNREHLLTELEGLKSEWHHVSDIAKKQYPNMSESEAVKQLLARINLTELYSEANTQLKISIIENIKKVVSEYKKPITVSFVNSSNYPENEKLFEELKAILQESGIRVSGIREQMNSASGDYPPVIIRSKPEDMNLTFMIAHEIGRVLKLEKMTYEDLPKLRGDGIEIEINGKPFFDENGIVTFKKSSLQ